MEIVIIDDCSNDEATHNALAWFEDKEDVRVRRTPRNSGGPALPRNLGIAGAKYDYIFPLDADDMMNNDPSFLNEHGDFFSAAFDQLEFDPSLALVSAAPKQFSHDPDARVSTYKTNPYLEDVMLVTSRLTVSSLMRKDDMIAAGGYPTDVKCVEDWLFYLKFLNTRLTNGDGIKVHKFDCTHLLYRQHAHGNNVNNRVRDWPAMYQRAVEAAPDLYAKHFSHIAPDKRAAHAMDLAGRNTQKKPSGRENSPIRFLQSIFPAYRAS